MSEINDWNATDGSNTTLGSIPVSESSLNVNQVDNAIRAIMGAAKRQVGAVNIATTVASASTTDLSATTGWEVSVTGTTTITALGTMTAGTVRILRFAGALTLTYNATSLILPGALSITTAANDVALMVSLGSGNWYCANYQRQSVVPFGAWELIGSGTPSAVAAVDITNLSAYRTLRVTGKLRPATDNTTLLLRSSSNNGSSFDIVSGDYENQQTQSDGTTIAALAFDYTGFQLSQTSKVNSGSAAGCAFSATIFDWNVAATAPIFSQSQTFNNVVSDNSNLVNSGRLALSVARNALRLTFISGNITSGYYVLEGIRG